jgi:hypothetical protein
LYASLEADFAHTAADGQHSRLLPSHDEHVSAEEAGATVASLDSRPSSLLIRAACELRRYLTSGLVGIGLALNFNFPCTVLVPISASPIFSCFTCASRRWVACALNGPSFRGSSRSWTTHIPAFQSLFPSST